MMNAMLHEVDSQRLLLQRTLPWKNPALPPVNADAANVVGNDSAVFPAMLRRISEVSASCSSERKRLTKDELSSAVRKSAMRASKSVGL